MRKFFNVLTAVALAVATAATLSACSDDDKDDPDDPDKPVTTKTVKESNLTVSLYFNQGMVDTYDIVATFLGQTVTPASKPVNVNVQGTDVPMYPLVLTGSGNTVPLSASFDLSFTVKEGYTVPEKSDFMMEIMAEGSITFTDNSTDTYTASGFSLNNKGVFGDKIAEYTQRLNENYGHIKADLELNGVGLFTGTEE